MPASRTFLRTPQNARDRLLEAAVKLVREQGFAATSVDQLCAEAGVTKGAFFHHFASKEALGVALAQYWTACTSALFAAAPYHAPADPVERVLGYIDFRIALVDGPPEVFSCVAGTLVQEAFRTSAAIRTACADSIMGNAETLVADIAAALAERGIAGEDPRSLARHVQTVIQGSFVIAKTHDASHAAAMAREALHHLRRYFELLFRNNDGKTCDGKDDFRQHAGD